MNLRDVYVDALNALECGSISLEEFQDRTSILLDAEPVVRCKDCKHGTEIDGYIQCDQDMDNGVNWGKDDYCSYGKKEL